MRRLIFLYIILVLAGCQSSDKLNGKKNSVRPLVIFDNEEGAWEDIRLSVTNIMQNDSAKIYTAISSYDNENVGLSIALPTRNEDTDGFGNKYIRINRIGIESDNLLHVLAKLYNQRLNANAKFASSINAKYVNLRAYGASLKKQKGNDSLKMSADYKLFFQTKDDAAELFLNVDKAGKWIELKEKDADYRPLIIKILSGED